MRGRSFADGKYWQEAESDLREALAVRTQDARRARTYGAHFIQYFGNRELGVVLYKQGARRGGYILPMEIFGRRANRESGVLSQTMLP